MSVNVWFGGAVQAPVRARFNFLQFRESIAANEVLAIARQTRPCITALDISVAIAEPHWVGVPVSVASDFVPPITSMSVTVGYSTHFTEKIS